MQRNAETHYPILLVHGLFGFERIGKLELFHGIKPALRHAGARVFVPYLSAVNSNELRGEQLLAQIDRVLLETGAPKVNLIGHSQGALAARYAGAKQPKTVASVTSVSGPNHGSELADHLRKALTPGRLPEYVAASLITRFAEFLTLFSSTPQPPHNAIAALNALTTEGVAAFNHKYPQGLPKTWGDSGNELVNGVRYFSWSGILTDNPLGKEPKLLDPLHRACRAFSEHFNTEPDANDGLVGRYSSHLGTVIRSDYPLDHMETINQPAGLARQEVDPVELYVQHAERLKNLGL
ncbi:esterase/lipase family protein [Pseudomonas fluorescens]|uniref:Triacylglycerol lipase n=1 Tax=Pseudomonas fluorescens TaxID=294 RepID=A0A5E7CYI5_PSEFL|nr:triacylglycerol lipase [Pseudomonas fluorescens]VVO04755.1 Triacylglycerol lipase [Pseudomonas fluorescens]